MIRRTFALAAGCLLAGSAAVAQPPADTFPHRERRLTLPIEFAADQRKLIQQVQLCVSRDQGQTWGVEDAVTPDKDHFVFAAKDDGVYWLTMVILFKDGKKDPADPSKITADRVQKNLIDTTPPAVRVTAARRDGDDVVVEWAVDDKFPNDPATQMSYKSAGPSGGLWQTIPADAITKRTARFKPAVPGPVVVQVNVQDSAGNPGVVTKELPAGTTAAYSPVVVPAAANQPSGLGAPSLPPPVLPGNSLPSPSLPSSGPAAPGPVVPAAPVAAPVPVAAPAPITPAPLPPAAPTWVPPSAPAPPTTPATPPADAGPQPIATSGGTAPPPPPPAAAPDTAGVQHIRFTQFQLQYQLEAGPSGVRQIDLYVTRDDGRTWSRWSQHDGKENPLRVNLAGRGGVSVDGDYGFKMVSVSGANLSDDIPTPGTPPDVRVHVDTAPPVIRIYPVEADPASRGALLLRWQAADRNLSESSQVGIDWSDTPAGPWRPVGGAEAGPLNLSAAPASRVPNRGTYSWQLPPNLPSHLLYFRFTATDPAGNRSEAIAPPQTVDLVRPRARIQSVVTAALPPR